MANKEAAFRNSQIVAKNNSGFLISQCALGGKYKSLVEEIDLRRRGLK